MNCKVQYPEWKICVLCTLSEAGGEVASNRYTPLPPAFNDRVVLRYIFIKFIL